MAAPHVRKDRPQYENIVKIFESFSSSHRMWEIWLDAMTIIACTISNAVDRRYFDEREKLYKDTLAKYSGADQERFADVFAEIVHQIDTNPEQDFLGDLYMQFDLGSHWHGQFFTPYDICRLMADVYRAAAAASVDHNAVLALRSELLTFASKFDKVITGDTVDLLDLLQAAKELISYAVITCSYKRIETTYGGGQLNEEHRRGSEQLPIRATGEDQ